MAEVRTAIHCVLTLDKPAEDESCDAIRAVHTV